MKKIIINTLLIILLSIATVMYAHIYVLYTLSGIAALASIVVLFRFFYKKKDILKRCLFTSIWIVIGLLLHNYILYISSVMGIIICITSITDYMFKKLYKF